MTEEKKHIGRFLCYKCLLLTQSTIVKVKTIKSVLKVIQYLGYIYYTYNIQ